MHLLSLALGFLGDWLQGMPHAGLRSARLGLDRGLPQHRSSLLSRVHLPAALFGCLSAPVFIALSPLFEAEAFHCLLVSLWEKRRGKGSPN